MNLSKYILLFSLGIASMTFTGCSDFLDRSPLGEFTENDAPGGSLDGQVFSIYSLMRSYNITAGIPAFAIHNFRSEDNEKGSSAGDGADQAEMFDNFVYTNNNGTVKAYWKQCFTIIYQCNSVITTVENGNLTDNASLVNKGEAYFFRAYAYFNLVRAFGEVPLVTFKVNDASEVNLPKTTVEKIYEQIDADLSEAEKLLPKQWESIYIGRLTWGAARSLHARTYMMRNDWGKLLEASSEVIQSGLYNLDTPFDKVFTEEGENCGESIFELQCASTASLPASTSIGSQFCQVQGVRGSGSSNLGWGWNMATVEIGKAFEPGDPRKDATLLYFNRSKDEEPLINKPYGESFISEGMGGYFNKKAYGNPTLRSTFTNSCFWVNIRLIRYSDVLLMFAEAANELGRTTEALAALEQVRARARGNDSSILPAIITTDQVELRRAIQHERRIELALEFDRFYDLVRWGIAKDVLHAVGKTNYQDKHRYLPLPQDEIDKSNGVLVQNPNY